MIKVIKEKSTASPSDNWDIRRVIREASKYDSVLDVGCGTGKVIKSIKAGLRVGVDICSEALAIARRHNNGVIFRACDLSILDSLVTGPMDCVIGIDIIEHFNKVDALLLLNQLERIAQKELLFFIPVGNHPQTKDDRGFGNDHFQTHRSTWHPSDMDQIGYEVWHYPNWHVNIKLPKEKGAMFCQKIL